MLVPGTAVDLQVGRPVREMDASLVDLGADRDWSDTAPVRADDAARLVPVSWLARPVDNAADPLRSGATAGGGHGAGVEHRATDEEGRSDDLEAGRQAGVDDLALDVRRPYCAREAVAASIPVGVGRVRGRRPFLWPTSPVGTTAALRIPT